MFLNEIQIVNVSLVGHSFSSLSRAVKLGRFVRKICLRKSKMLKVIQCTWPFIYLVFL